MPRRTTIFVAGECYHIFNRSIADEPIFRRYKDYIRFQDLVDFYRFERPAIRFSHYNRLEKSSKEKFIKNLHSSGKKLVEILAFCYMPNHYHFLLKEMGERGIPNFIRNLQNSYAKYLNKKSERNGSLFQEMFKAVHIQSETQLIHLFRYIHLNPVTSYLLKDPSQLETYQWTSFPDYVGSFRRNYVDTEFIGKLFKSSAELKRFTYDRADYQRKLARIKYLTLE